MSRRGARLLGLCAAVVLVGAGLAGCGRPAGVDGDLTNGWPAMPAAKVGVPVAGVCYDDAIDDTWYGDFNSVACASASHSVETVFVGAFTGTTAGRSTPPPAGNQARVDAYAQCRKGAVDYLGADYHNGPFDLLMVLPNDLAWTGGARWFRCDIGYFSGSGSELVEDGSVKDGLRGARPLARSCGTVTDDGHGKFVSLYGTDCAKPHNSEFAGLFTGPAIAWPGDADTRDALASAGCERVVASYLGFTGGKVDSAYLGWEYSLFDEDQWNLGDRTIQCSVLGFSGDSSNGSRFVGSLKGIRGGKPKG